MAEVVLQDYRQVVFSNETVTTSGSAVFDGFGSKEMNLIINITATPTGTTPTITFEIQEVDPGDQTTVLGNSSVGASLNSQTTQIVSLPIMYSGTVKVSWTVTGAGATFTGLYASLVSKNAGTTSLYSATGVAAFGPAGTPGATAITVQGISGGQAIPVTFTASSDTTATGTITNTQNVVIATQGKGNVGVLLGTTAFTGTVVFEGTIDGTDWFAILAFTASTGAPVSSATANGEWTIPCAGYQQIRVRGNTVATGTATVNLDASVGAPTAISVAAGGFAPAGATAIGNPTLVGPLTDDNLVGQFAFGEAHRLRVGQESISFLDNFDGTTINTVRWAQSTSGMTQVQAQTSFDMNNNATTTANAYSILTSTKKFMLTGEYAVESRIKAKLTPQTNAVIELGFFTASTNTAPTNGVFFRITSAGVQELVINFNGTETTSVIAAALTAANYYTFVLYMYGTIARLDILNWDNSLFATTTLQIPTSQGALIQKGHIPVAVRVYNTATPPGTAAEALVTGVSVSHMDSAANKSWEAQLGDMARFGNLDPLTGVQLQNFTNSAAPSTIAAGSLSNTAAAYSTLGGLFAFNTVASAETDYILFAYQVPTDFDLMIWSVSISTLIIGAQSSTQPTVLQWGLAVGSSAVSLATAGANPPLRQALGMQQAPKSASLGDSLTPGQLIWTPKVPIVCYGGKYVHVILRVVTGNQTANQINRGIVTFDAAFQ